MRHPDLGWSFVQMHPESCIQRTMKLEDMLRRAPRPGRVDIDVHSACKSDIGYQVKDARQQQASEGGKKHAGFFVGGNGPSRRLTDEVVRPLTTGHEWVRRGTGR